MEQKRYLASMKNKLMQIVGPTCQMLAAYTVLHLFKRSLLRMNIWTVGEKKTEARDNGYHFFNYVHKNHPEVNIYYIIAKGAPDEKELPADRVVHFGTFRHKLYCLAAINCIGGQAHANKPYYNIPAMKRVYDRLKRKSQKLIWISHGVRKDKIDAYSPKVTNYSLFTVATQTEYKYYKKEFEIPENKIALTGLCRFDNLHQFKTKRQILVMPTFRSWLKPRDTSVDEVPKEMEEIFVKSSFFSHYFELLTSQRLQSMLATGDIQLIFYLHYSFQPYRKLFEGIKSPNIVIAGRNDYDVQALLKESSLLVTDYSSVFFDFCYMKKPVIYYQFDKEEYRRNHYKEGYWSYERDGFGPIVEDIDSVIADIERAVERNFEVALDYKGRMKDYFQPYDANNCARLYRAIRKLNEQQ